jgi:hypothetical protein
VEGASTMSDKWNWKQFYRFTELRNQLRNAKRDKNYHEVLSLGRQILDLEKTAKFIQIIPALFLKEIGNAYLKLNDTTSAIEYLQLAKDSLVEYRRTAALNQPTDFLRDIEALEGKIARLRSSVRQ